MPTMRAMARALASMRSGFLVAAGNGITSPPTAVESRRQPAGLGQHQRPPAGAHDGIGDLDRGQLRAAGIELRDDLQYGRPVFGTRSPFPRTLQMARLHRMADAQPQFLDVGSGAARRAHRLSAAAGDASGDKPGLVWLCGLKSEMASTKASALAEWAAEQGVACLRFDYSGHGQSDGRFEDGTVTRWLEETRAAFEQLTQGPQVLVGSSMGGYIALLLLRAPDGRSSGRGRARQGAGADRAGLGYDRADVGKLSRRRPPGHRGEGRLPAAVRLRRRALSDHARLPRGRPRAPDRRPNHSIPAGPCTSCTACRIPTCRGSIRSTSSRISQATGRASRPFPMASTACRAPRTSPCCSTSSTAW